MLSSDAIKKINVEIGHYDEKRAASIEALKVVQEENGWVSDEHLKETATILGMSTEELDSVATFYNLIFRKPVGRHVILVCSSISCWIMGYDNLLRFFAAELGVEPGETTADDRFTLIPMPCLGTCDRAPAFMIDNDTHRDINVEKPDDIRAILKKYE